MQKNWVTVNQLNQEWMNSSHVANMKQKKKKESSKHGRGLARPGQIRQKPKSGQAGCLGLAGKISARDGGKRCAFHASVITSASVVGGCRRCRRRGIGAGAGGERDRERDREKGATSSLCAAVHASGLLLLLLR